MDLKTLSQQLNMSLNELQDRIREAGLRLPPRAKKINNTLAREIMRRLSQKKGVIEEIRPSGPAKVSIGSFISVKEFADKLGLPVTTVIKKLLENGVMATINEEIDAETAAIIGQELGVEVKEEQGSSEVRLGLGYVWDEIAKEDPAKLVPRPPIVAVMGHVDHGKTTLLDAIRKTNIAAKEAGAITQHIGAYQVEAGGKPITFLDTPGHEAFAAMRARGANVTDVIVLVVAADDSVKPQTMEVINRAKLTKTPMVIAINKVDKPSANPERVKSDLAAVGVTVEDWGGNVPVVPVSAKTRIGIDKLLEIILLTAELEELRANPEGTTLGTVIESHLSASLGPVATILVQNGTLRAGDIAAVGGVWGKIRAMHDDLGKKLKQAAPGAPTQISGLSDQPKVGDILSVAADLEEAKRRASVIQKQDRVKRLQAKKALEPDPNKKELRLIIRADVQGSLEAIMEALSKLESDEVKLVIVDQGVGEITDSDITLAENTKSAIVSFSGTLSARAAKLAKQKNVVIDQYDVIYELMEDVTQALLSMMTAQIEEVPLGRVKIKAIFRTEKQDMIVGGEVIEGKIVDKKKFKIFRDKTEAGEGKIEELQQNRIEVEEVGSGKEFGIKARLTSSLIQAGDILEIFDEVVKKKELKK